MYVIIIFCMNIYILLKDLRFYFLCFEMQRIFIVHNPKFFMHIFVNLKKLVILKVKSSSSLFFFTLLFFFLFLALHQKIS